MNTEQIYIYNKLIYNIEELTERKAYAMKVLPNLPRSKKYLLDERDYSIYSIVKIGKQYWLGENLRYVCPEAFVMEGDDFIRKGCLYSWVTAMDISEEYEGALHPHSPGDSYKHQGIAPKGCYIPSDEDWMELERFLGMGDLELLDTTTRGKEEAIGLKSCENWRDGFVGDNRTGFNALAAGYTYKDDDKVSDADHFATFWSTTQKGEQSAWDRCLTSGHQMIIRYPYYKSSRLSLRCLVDIDAID